MSNLLNVHFIVRSRKDWSPLIQKNEQFVNMDEAFEYAKSLCKFDHAGEVEATKGIGGERLFKIIIERK